MRVSRDPRRPIIVLLTVSLGFAACGDPADDADTPPVAPEPAVAGCTPAGPLVAPQVSGLAPPAGTELYLRLRAEGTQIYTCGGDAGGVWRWTLKAPDARLIDDSCLEVGTHFAGPSWKVGRDGSTVVGRKAAESPAPVQGAIPWLLIETVTASAGMLGGVSHIQRVDTVGGTAPMGGCDATSAGSEQPVPYLATYLYYRAGGTAMVGGLRAGY